MACVAKTCVGSNFRQCGKIAHKTIFFGAAMGNHPLFLDDVFM